ncbi:acetylglutamate kinase [Candidatus Roizmanbacteria bacterium CG_4_9_14_3_um_filter_33_18]|uniref:Acetylglutamate kinase n=3 Tax=Candidatus Roizmaniibacteriota TaxID=1752723 RepID=A0A2M7U8I4_9BACT|nr:MAG: acetylglutamate kinase [Candidatus Roizmanbacteria bacterium CG22_combo_CG10-13_8_21_14_all_34_12]PIZ67512.1 MAG: acetylglutamate kinase [Candidatus Roizmanbacteria bacterium CG_4_10_14_0_2_um_filter_33_96]PJA56031.1 MAG: acetylglutamate kinase [Candidatus Roizmanbacteria bacterium CG_4_9_14_3_um_filter_33_18]
MILIKIGGGKKINLNYICEDIKTLTDQGEKVVLVHGASVIRDEIAKKIGAPTKTITSPTGISSVYTDKTAIDVFLMAYPGLVNKTIVARLQSYGVNAVGLSGIDGQLWKGKRKVNVYSKEGVKTKLITDNMTGKVTQININLINLLLNNKYLPVVCPPALSEENEIINTDNDWAVAVMSGALKIEKMVVLFEAPGLLKKFGDESSLIKIVNKDKLDTYLTYTQGRMKKKLLGAKEAFTQGLKKLYWSDGRIKNPIINALKGTGTIIS